MHSLLSYFFKIIPEKEVIALLVLGAYIASNRVSLQCDHMRLTNYRFNMTFCNPYSVRIVQCIQRFFSKPRQYEYRNNTVKQKFIIRYVST